MNKFYIYLFLLFSLTIFISCGENAQTTTGISCTNSTECSGGFCDPADGKCKLFACSPSENTCLEDGKTAHVCKSDGSGFEDTLCSFKCNNGECVDKIQCLPYSKICTTNTEYIECSANGLNWDKVKCEENKFCLEGECKGLVCTPSEKICTDSFHVKSCNANGTAELEYKCPNDEECVLGGCVKINCTPNETKCDENGKLITCSEDGFSWGTPTDCEDGKSCSDGECKNIICNTGEIVCSSDSNRYYKECDDSKTQWSAPILCGDNKVCNNNQCVSTVCYPDERKCDENGSVVICNEDSLSWSTPIECLSNQVCKRGACVEFGECVANEKRCLDGNDGYFESCDQWGTSWLNPISCGAGNICSEGECVSILCAPNQVKCVSGDTSMTKYQVCNDNGTAYLEEETCSNGEICLGDACRSITCTPGDKICNNNEIMECNADGSARESILDCGVDKSCVNGDCEDKICTPNAQRCVEGTNQFIETCNSTGTAWENRLSCGTGSICSNDTCVSLVCSPGQTKCDINVQDSYLTCNEGGSAFENLTACPDTEFCMTGLCMECFPGSKECIDDDNFKVCNNEGRWENSTPCAGGDKCEDGSCAVKICEPNEVQCLVDNTQYFKTCNSLGTAWLAPVSCGAGNTCENNLCTPILCIRDTTECFSSSSYIECNSTGTSYSNPIACNNGEECLSGSCRSTICTPGEKVCDGNGIKECNELGQWDPNIISCGSKVCELGVCNDVICTPLEYRCDANNSNYREQCNANGTSWTNNAPCGSSKTCNLGVCENIICVAGESICSGTTNAYLTCNSIGTAYDTSTNCTNTQYCNNGACVAQVCTPNERVCDGNSVKICNDLGSNYSNPQACTDGTICNNGICEATICTSGETRCDGALIQTCSSNGTTWETGVACPNGQTCSGNICIDYVCNVNERECVNNSLYKECNATRTGFSDPIACGTNKICTGAGVCEDRLCAPGQTKCVTTDATFKTYQICNSTGSAWENPVSCSDSLICDVDTNVCKSVICNSGDIRCLDNNGTPQSQTCNTTGSGWNTAVDCTGVNPICTETGCDNVICDAYEEIQCTGNTPTEYKRCNVNGTDWITATENCANNYLCKDNSGTDECTPIVCTPNSKVCSSDTGYRVCSADGTELAAETTCANSAASGQPMTCYAGECRTECDMAAVNKSYMGCEYYAVDLQNSYGEYRHRGEDSPFYYAVIISNPSASSVSVTITDNLGYSSTRFIGSNAIEIFEMDTLVDTGSYVSGGRTYYTWNDTHQLTGTGFGEDYSYKIDSELPIVAYQFSPLGGSLNFSNDASLLIPITAYGNEYRFLSWGYWFFDDPNVGEIEGPSVMTIVAQEDNTVVTVNLSSNTEAGGTIPAYNSGDTHTQTLSKGEILQFVNTSGDMSGSLISADKDIGVFGGHDCTFIPYNQWACDHIEQQLFPTSTWGNNYLAVKTSQRGTEDDYYKIVANEDNTIVTLTPNVSGTSPITMNEGDVIQFNTDEDFKISSSKAVMVGQFMASQNAGANTGDPAFILQVPIEQFREDYLFLVPEKNGTASYANNYVTVVAPTTATITLDSNLVANVDFVNIGTTGYKRAIVSLTGGTHSIVATEPVGISVYGYDSYVSYGYPGGLNLKAVK